MELELGESWGDLSFQDAPLFLDQPDSASLEFVAIAVDGEEAVSKALGTGTADVNFTDIEVVNDERGKPELVLHNNAKQLAEQQGFTQWSISISHTTTHAIGFAVALNTTQQGQTST